MHFILNCNLNRNYLKKGSKVALNKIQTFIKKLSESQNVKRVVGDIQTISEDLQKRVKHLSKDDAIKKYKEIMKKVSQTEGDLEKEVNKVIVKIKKSKTNVEKSLQDYKKKAVARKHEFEKILKSKAGKAAPKKATAKKSTKKVSRKKASTK